MKYNIQKFKPFKVIKFDDEIHLLFSGDDISFMHENVIFSYVPDNQNRIVVDRRDFSSLLNPSTFFLFYHNGAALRLPLRVVAENSQLMTLIENHLELECKIKPFSKINLPLPATTTPSYSEFYASKEIEDVLYHTTLLQYDQAIDAALESKDKNLFESLCLEKNNYMENHCRDTST